MSIPDQIVGDPELVVIIIGLVQTDRQTEGHLPDIILPMVDNGLLYIPIVREMFISVSSQIVIGSRDKTGAGHR